MSLPNVCWICGEVANSKEHKFKASDIKKAYGKKFEAYFVNGKTSIKFTSFKDDLIQFPKVICIDCNNRKTRSHDNAYDEFIKFCLKNHKEIMNKGVLDFQDIFGDDWLEKKVNLYRYYAKHAGCKVITSGFNFDLSNVATFIKSKDVCEDFLLKFEIKQAIGILIQVINKENKYSHLYNSETICYRADNSIIFGGWSTNNYITANWIIGKSISDADYLKMYEEKENVILTDSKFPADIKKFDNEEFISLAFINDVHIAYENGYNQTPQDKINYFEWIIDNQ